MNLRVWSLDSVDRLRIWWQNQSSTSIMNDHGMAMPMTWVADRWHWPLALVKFNSSVIRRVILNITNEILLRLIGCIILVKEEKGTSLQWSITNYSIYAHLTFHSITHEAWLANKCFHCLVFGVWRLLLEGAGIVVRPWKLNSNLTSWSRQSPPIEPNPCGRLTPAIISKFIVHTYNWGIISFILHKFV